MILQSASTQVCPLQSAARGTEGCLPPFHAGQTPKLVGAAGETTSGSPEESRQDQAAQLEDKRVLYLPSIPSLTHERFYIVHQIAPSARTGPVTRTYEKRNMQHQRPVATSSGQKLDHVKTAKKAARLPRSGSKNYSGSKEKLQHPP